MPSLGRWGLPTALLTLLCCSGPAEITFEVDVWPEKLAVETSGSGRVNCSTTCTQPELGGLETSLTKQLVDQRPQWQQYLVSNISQDVSLICYFFCAGNSLTKTVHISVYQPPQQVTLKLRPIRVALGTAFTAECGVAAVKPLEGLTLTLQRGQETLQNWTSVEAAPARGEGSVTFNRTAQGGSGPLTFRCQAALDLRSKGGDVIYSVSEAQVLQVYEPVQDSQMVIIVTVVSVLLFLFVTSILLCFIMSHRKCQRQRGYYGVLEAWRRLPQAFRTQHV
ncbi:intercellular adhesion molecule 2 [Octodon degus]|uniref:Intercellular adhesion molecule 2 n=1 Tax=Octodon degus TaxID=10160 RepID=A0A6P3F4G7_OCTDE|nr:intercellular adhesion molecule 2 [Octodon degus]